MRIELLLAVTIAAASSTRPVLEKRRAALERASGAPIVLVYGATGALARQLENGAPFDLFLAADEETPARLAKAGVLDAATVRPYAKGTLVLVADPRARLALPKTLARGSARALFAQPFRRLAIASPKIAPYGRAAVELLRALGLLDAVASRIVEGESVEQAAAYVSSGNAELGLVAASVARGDVARVPIDPALGALVVHAGGVVSRSREREPARRAFAALATPESRAVFAEHGYAPP